MSCYLYENHRASPTLILLYVLGVLGVLNVLHVLHVLHLLHVLHVLHGRIVGLLGLVINKFRNLKKNALPTDRLTDPLIEMRRGIIIV